MFYNDYKKSFMVIDTRSMFTKYIYEKQLFSQWK